MLSPGKESQLLADKNRFYFFDRIDTKRVTEGGEKIIACCGIGTTGNISAPGKVEHGVIVEQNHTAKVSIMRPCTGLRLFTPGFQKEAKFIGEVVITTHRIQCGGQRSEPIPLHTGIVTQRKFTTDAMVE